MAGLIVIVNYRTTDLTIDCLCSLGDENQLVPGRRVVPRKTAKEIPS
jgi:hypothetical protein